MLKRLLISLSVIPVVAFGQANQPIKADASYNVLPLRINGNPPNLPAGTLLDGVPIATGDGGTWGSIVGTLSDQLDLQAALDAKVPTSRTISTTAPVAGGGALSGDLTLSMPAADATHDGYLSLTDWNTFNGKQNALTFGDLTDVGTDGITVTGGTGAVIGTGVSLSQHVADSTHNGYLSSVDWTAFNGAVSAAGVSSWNSRTGAVVPAQDDYLFTQLAFTGSNLTSLETRSYNDLQDLPNLNMGSHLISGGGIAWTGTGYNYIVSAATYLINGVEYSSAETPLTLSAAHPTNDRIDVFAVDSSGNAVVIEGTPGGPPLEPSIDPATQLRLTSAYVPAGSTEPVASIENIYFENTEWTTSTNSAGTINLASTNNPYAGTKDVEGTSTVGGNLFTATKPSGTISLAEYNSLVFYVRSKGSWPRAKSVLVYWMNGGVQVGGALPLRDGAWNFDSSNTTTYQQIVVPASSFVTGAAVLDSIRFQVAGGGSSIGWYIDNVYLQSGVVPPPTTGGDFSTNTNTSVANEIVLFADTTGKLGQRSTGTGIAKLTSGVLGTATEGSDYLGPLRIDDTAYNATSWDGDTTHAPSKNAVRDELETIIASVPAVVSDTAFGSSWNAVTTIAPSKNAVYDWGHTFDTDDDGKVNVLDQVAGLAFTDASGVLQSPKVIGTDVQAWDTQLDSLAALSYGSNALKVVRVNSGEDGFELATISATTGGTVGFTSDGAGAVLTTGVKGYFTVPYAGTITGWSITATGSSPTCTIDVWKIGTGTALPTVSNTITASAKPALATGNAIRSSTLTGWTTSFSAGDIFGFNIDAVTVATKITFALEVTH